VHEQVDYMVYAVLLMIFLQGSWIWFHVYIKNNFFFLVEK
jgi:hypothetical protein